MRISSASLSPKIPLTTVFYSPSARLAGIHIGGNASLGPDTDNGPRGDFGLIGLAVMGQNLILNAADHGVNVVAFNRTVSKVDHFLANEAKGKLQFSGQGTIC
jgi:6-phosphogluconate dehydrogenase-like protein